MKKSYPRSLAYLLVLSALSLPTFALTPVGPCDPCDPVPQPKVYAAGVAYTPNWQAVMWVDGVRTDLPPLVNSYNTGARDANAIVVVDNFETGEPDVYVAGTANVTTNNAMAAESSAMVWKNGEIFSQIPSISSTYANSFAGAYGLAIDNGNLYTAGFTDKLGVSGPQGNFAEMKPIQWKNGVQTLLPLNPGSYRGTAKGIYVRNGVTYTVGNHSYDTSGGPTTPYGSPEIWVNGVSLTASNGPLAEINTVFATTSNLYVGGAAPMPGSPLPLRATYAYRSTSWGTTSAAAPPAGVMFNSVYLPSNNNQATVTGMFVVGTRVYSVGWELRPSGKYVAKLWINTSGVDLSLENESAVATSVYVRGYDVYVGGSINNNVNQRPKAVIWKNGQMIDLNGAELGSQVTSIFVK
ncbi:hypothetical protein [Lysobacter tyrosinilyticus]